jgi:hypothetical protein
MSSKRSTKPTRPIIVKVILGGKLVKFVGASNIHKTRFEYVIKDNFLLNGYQMSARDRHGQTFFFKVSGNGKPQIVQFSRRFEDLAKVVESEFESIAPKLWEKVQIEFQKREYEIENQK